MRHETSGLEILGSEVEHGFKTIGRRVMQLNARQTYREIGGTHLILLAMEDMTERKRATIKL